MTTALAPVARRLRQCRIEEDQRFRTHPAILDEAEAQGVRARSPGQVRWCRSGRNHGIGESCAIDMQPQAQFARDIPNRGDLVRAIGHAIFGGVGNRNRVGLYLMHVLADGTGNPVDRVG